MNFPQDLRYTKDHEWARKNAGGTITVGVTAFAVDQLGDITQVDLPEVGALIKAGDSLGTIESVKSVSDLFAPVSGKVAAINEQLADRPELVNESCYGDGWMVEIAPTGTELAALLDPKAYADLVTAAS
jgi:glycine cleavage system H protein